jgi:hypothetical protein
VGKEAQGRDVCSVSVGYIRENAVSTGTQDANGAASPSSSGAGSNVPLLPSPACFMPLAHSIFLPRQTIKSIKSAPSLPHSCPHPAQGSGEEVLNTVFAE